MAVPRNPENLPEPSILLQDEDVLALDKPPGWLVIPGRDPARDGPALRQWAEARAGPLLPVHRLDRDTSGVLLFARNPEAHRALNQDFEHHRVDKLYWALVRGSPASERGDIDLPLHPARKGKMRPASPGEPGALAASSRYQVLERFRAASWLEVRIFTGRQHQVRVHLRAIGHPLAFDPLYGGAGAALPGLTRVPLHAAVLGFPHPRRPGEKVVVRAALPTDLAQVLDALRAEAFHHADPSIA